MKWTSELPTVAGWYWWRGPMYHLGVVEVVAVSASEVRRSKSTIGVSEFGDGDLVTRGPTTRVNAYPGVEWAGPIAAPEGEEQTR